MMKLAVVGAGYRCYHNYAVNLGKSFSDKVKIVAACDPNPKRIEFYRNTIDKDIKSYSDFDAMLAECRPDAVLVTTVDKFHHEYVVRALEAGVNVYCEKPLTIGEEQCRAIRNAEKKSGKKVVVTFNCRFMPYALRLKKIIDSGTIGKILTVNYEYTLNRVHGGDYFKRWHRMLGNCGGMLVHKATHHFDLVNWFIGDEPASVCALGARLHYGNDDRPHGERCSSCEYKETCESYEDLSRDEEIRGIYTEPESVDGYVRDHCVFKPDTDIYDSMSVSVYYKKGTLLTYSLNLFSAKEGYTIHFTGEKGRIEASDYFDGGDNVIKILRYDGSEETYTFPRPSGMHAGADEPMLEVLFGGKPDTLGQCSGSYDGIKSAIIGIAANRSIKEGKRIDVDKFLEEIR